MGGFCSTNGNKKTTPRCWANPTFKGAGHEFIQASKSVEGKFYAPCGESLGLGGKDVKKNLAKQEQKAANKDNKDKKKDKKADTKNAKKEAKDVAAKAKSAVA